MLIIIYATSSHGSSKGNKTTLYKANQVNLSHRVLLRKVKKGVVSIIVCYREALEEVGILI